MKFKYLFLLLMGVVCGLACSACSYEDDDYDEPSFKVLNPELSFDGAGGVQTINVQADAQPTASVIEGADWCSVAYKDPGCFAFVSQIFWRAVSSSNGIVCKIF